MSIPAELPQTLQEPETAHLFQMTRVLTDTGPVNRLDITGGLIDEGFDPSEFALTQYQTGEKVLGIPVRGTWFMTKIKNSGHLTGDGIIRKGPSYAVKQLAARGNVLTQDSAAENFIQTVNAITELDTAGRGVESTTYATIIGNAAIGRLSDVLSEREKSNRSHVGLLALSGLSYIMSYGAARHGWDEPGW